MLLLLIANKVVRISRIANIIILIFGQRYHEEKVEINRNLQSLNLSSSNLENDIQKALWFTSKLNTVWDSNPVKQKEALQNFIFPEGIYYDTKNEAVLTPKANPFFEQIAVLKRVLKDDTNDKGTNNGALSCYVVLPVQFSNLFIMDLKRLASIVA